MKDTELIYRILAKVFNEVDKGLLYEKIIDFSKNDDEVIDDFISSINIKMELR